jgi:hypothetical protein
VRAAFVPHLAAQGTLAVTATAGDTVLWLDTEVRCATGRPSCGFRAGQRAVLSTGVSASSVAIDHADEGTVTLASPLPAAFPAGAVLAELLTVTYGVRHGGDGSSRLVRITSGGAEQPVLDNLVEFTVSTDSGDPVAPARLFVTLRVQAPSERLRGPAGYLFRHAGTATQGRRWIPDVEIRTAVAVRNGLPSW